MPSISLSKNNHHEKFNDYVDDILAQPDMKKKLNELGVMTAITQARKMGET